ncbi:MAG: oligopeptidase A [Betaproteobacteria bacterium CG2_30_59_46]|nr:MAG: oligopeptidase A [Betaproteobacteria bacterium CG2_30_59_46]PIQ10326.1 MAG: oligopeptidase A [Hydrogenophilales bacterium CG18_big_fil_WC_8_21_14_2_50_58_12]PIX98736.1 MAG: oligopeptidase A [Hydrogenophilales bacterium CG_4_10_14_3_um_filter_58_23]PJB07957.1 MAG: oligopeptidase A [Hydrogenophilales bacterium CG_4_9_14_3_um_filter_59_35]
MNPLLDFSGLPRFPEIKPEHVTPAVDALLAENRALVGRLAAEAGVSGWDSFVQPLEDANERLSRAWGQVSHLNAVMNSPELREVYNENLPKITAYYADLSQNLALFGKFKALRGAPAFEALSAPRKKIIDNEVRDFRLGGAELAEDKKPRFKAIQEELSALSARFEENLLDATNDFGLIVENESELAGIPDDAMQAAREAAQKDAKPGWKFTLHAPSYMPVMQYADNRGLREQVYRAYVTRASEFGKAELDNTGLIADILRLRREAAQLLGFANYAEVSLATKMAQSPRQVLDFLDDLAARAKPYAERDFRELTEFARDELGLADLTAWDAAYASEKLRLKRYAFSDNEVKQYFPESIVLPGMFKMVETLYGLSIKPTPAPVWHGEVRFYTLSDKNNEPVGQFYLDLYARDHKRGGAWMDDAISRRRRDGAIQVPVAYLNCNFSAPVGGKPALFTHDEVITLFHEFGHGLHHLLTRIEDLGVSGISGVEWDAVELPSQFMENFCWEWEVVRHMAKHVDTGEVLPRSLFDKMVNAKNFQSGMQTVRQIEFSLFDMLLHDDFDPDSGTALQLLNEIRRRVAVMFPPDYNRFPNNFSHIFAGGYGAGYYSYKWAEVLSADAYSLFEENGVLSPETGHRFWSEILGVGGSRTALESFTAFRGREPSIDALLKHNGMTGI